MAKPMRVFRHKSQSMTKSSRRTLAAREVWRLQSRATISDLKERLTWTDPNSISSRIMKPDSPIWGRDAERHQGAGKGLGEMNSSLRPATASEPMRFHRTWWFGRSSSLLQYSEYLTRSISQKLHVHRAVCENLHSKNPSKVESLWKVYSQTLLGLEAQFFNGRWSPIQNSTKSPESFHCRSVHHPGQSSSKDMEQARHRPVEGHILFRPTSFKAIPGNMQQHVFLNVKIFGKYVHVHSTLYYIYIYTARGKRYMRYVSRLYNPVYIFIYYIYREIYIYILIHTVYTSTTIYIQNPERERVRERERYIYI